MRSSVLPLLRSAVIWGSLGFVIALPIACAEGGSIPGILGTPTSGATGSSSSGAGGTPSTSVGGFPSATGSTSSASGTGGAGGASGFPSATGTGGGSGFPTSSATTSTGFPTASATTGVTTGSSGGSSSCDKGSASQTNCDNCGSCAGNLPTCSALITDCEFDCTCSAVLCCVQAGEPVADCTLIYGDSPIFDQLNTCLECACVNSCGVSAGTCP